MCLIQGLWYLEAIQSTHCSLRMEGARQSIVIDGVSWEEDDHVYAVLLLDLLLQFFLQFYILGAWNNHRYRIILQFKSVFKPSWENIQQRRVSHQFWRWRLGLTLHQMTEEGRSASKGERGLWVVLLKEWTQVVERAKRQKPRWKGDQLVSRRKSVVGEIEWEWSGRTRSSAGPAMQISLQICQGF